MYTYNEVVGFNQGVGAMHGGMHVISPHIDTPIPSPARQLQTRGGMAKVKHPPTAPAVPPIVAPTAVKQAAQARGPALPVGRRARRRITIMVRAFA